MAKKLTAKQLQAAEIFAANPDIQKQQVSLNVGVTPHTMSRWWKMPEFHDAIIKASQPRLSKLASVYWGNLERDLGYQPDEQRAYSEAMKRVDEMLREYKGNEGSWREVSETVRNLIEETKDERARDTGYAEFRRLTEGDD